MQAPFSQTDYLKLRSIIKQAGKAVLTYWRESGLEAGAIDYKSDGTPLSLADRKAHDLIKKGLEAFMPDIPVISEEDESQAPQHLNALRFFLVDPVDGTREFIKGRKEFTINIALCEKGTPVFGLVYAPALDKLWVGDVLAKKAWLEAGGSTQLLPLPMKRSLEEGLVVVASASHGNKEALEHFLKGRKIARLVNKGSSLKLCMVASGEADLYPRQGPTMFWDTAAAHAVVLAAGGYVKSLNAEGHAGADLCYRDSSLRNPWFLVGRGCFASYNTCV